MNKIGFIGLTGLSLAFAAGNYLFMRDGLKAEDMVERSPIDRQTFKSRYFKDASIKDKLHYLFFASNYVENKLKELE